MKLSSRSRYGLRAMIEIALKSGDEDIFIKNISQKHGISYKYLDRIISTLIKKGLLMITSRKHGGYKLSRDASQISAYQVVEALEGSLSPMDCVDNPSSCKRHAYCAAGKLWKSMKKSIIKSLDVSLKELALDQGALENKIEELDN